MFFVINNLSKEMNSFQTPARVASFMLGRQRSQYTVFYCPLSIDVSGDECFTYGGIMEKLDMAIRQVRIEKNP